MSGATLTPTPADLHVLDGIELHGAVNVDNDGLIANVEHAIRLGFPQAQPHDLNGERVLLVGGGPSLDDTLDELVELYMAGAKIVTLNGAYAWCLRHHLRPSAQIVVDARPDQGHFLEPAVPNCQYLVASQCAPSTWAAVCDGRERVTIWHAADAEGTLCPTLDAYYFGHWHAITGGTTVAMRALCLLRTLGFYRFDLFGIDSCWTGARHHAYTQIQNERDARVPFKVWPTGSPDRAREFLVSPWHVKQLEDFLQLVKLAGDQFLMRVHGNGLLAFALEEAVEWSSPDVVT
jgi:hypothetical protein